MPSLRQVAPPRLRNLTTKLGWNEGQPDGQVEPGDAMYLWVAQFVAITTALTSDQIDLILSTFGKAIRQYGNKFAAEFDADNKQITTAHLMIADNKFASVSGAEVFLSLVSGDVTKSLSRPPAIVLSYNMGEIYMRALGSLNRQKDGEEVGNARRSPLESD